MAERMTARLDTDKHRFSFHQSPVPDPQSSYFHVARSTRCQLPLAIFVSSSGP